ncbi:MAG: DUF418 domain-containing protein [bacterium]|nr:DUF418 domain-containing protein [bacterium]
MTTADATTTAAPGMTGRCSPVAEHERVFTLDALRGVAIFGVLVANVVTFIVPIWSPGPPTSAGAGGDQVALPMISAFVEGKFYVLFSLLFGMGLALQSARAEASSRPFAGLYVRRLVVLLLFGFAHGVLLFSGDVLAFYAFLGFIALGLRNLPTRTLLVLTIVLYLVDVLAVGVYAAYHPGSPKPGVPDWQRLAEERRAALILLAADDGAATETTALEQDPRLAFFEFMADERRIFQSGSWWEMTRYRAATFFLVGAPLRLTFASWRLLALFVLGVYLVRRFVFLEQRPHRPLYVGWLVGGFLGGMLLQGLAVASRQAASTSTVLFVINSAALLAGGFALSFSYAGGVALLCLTRWGRAALRPVAAVGRMALTNYLMSSIVFGLVFYSYGLGLFGRLTVAQAVLVALALYVAELFLSSLWLRFFRFGPFEWLWRTLTYRRIEPLARSRTLGNAGVEIRRT